MTDIEPLHRFAYDGGADPIEYAVQLAAIQIEARDMIRAARVYSPNAYPIFLGSLEDDAVARRIIAVLLDAGWTPPDVLHDNIGGDMSIDPRAVELAARIAEKGSTDDGELPGMWERADYTGGLDEVREAESAPPEETTP